MARCHVQRDFIGSRWTHHVAGDHTRSDLGFGGSSSTAARISASRDFSLLTFVSLDDGARMSRAEEVWKSVRAEQKHVQQQLLIPLSNFYLAEDKYLSNQGRSENARERGREGRRESDTPSMITATLAAYGSVIHASASSRQEWKLTPRFGDERFDMRWKMSSG